MPRPRRPFIDLSDKDAAKLRKARFNYQSITNWRKKLFGPSQTLVLEINAILGRDVRQPAPVAVPLQATDEPVVNNRMPPPPVASHSHIEINPCVDDGVCLAVRKAAMRPVANTLADQRREIPCTNCKEGKERARAEAKKKVRDPRYSLVCPECEGKKYPGSLTCTDCASERKRVGV